MDCFFRVISDQNVEKRRETRFYINVDFIFYSVWIVLFGECSHIQANSWLKLEKTTSENIELRETS